MISRKTRKIRIGKLEIGGDSPIAVQSMAATQTQNLEATARQIEVLEEAHADVIRIAVDNEKDVEALRVYTCNTWKLLFIICRILKIRKTPFLWIVPTIRKMPK